MMRDDDLVELFRALDNDASTKPPPYIDDLWTELDEALTRQHSSGSKPPIADADIIELRPRPDSRTSRFQMRRLIGAVALVAAALLLLLALPLDQRDDVTTQATQPTGPTNTGNATPSTQPAAPTNTVDPSPAPRLTVPSDACQRYAASQPTLANLPQRALDGDLTVGDIEAATTALSMLQADLAASGEYTDGDLRRIGAALEALREGSIELEMGLDEQAAGSLSTADITSELLLPLGPGEELAQPCVDTGG